MEDPLVDSIRASVTERGFPPSVRELADEYGVAIGTMHKWLKDAEKEGRIERGPGARSIRIIEGET